MSLNLRHCALNTVLFDLDGTLVDSAPDLGRAANLMRMARGLPELPLGTYRAHGGAGARGMLFQAFALQPGDAGYGEYREEFLERYQRVMFESTTLFAGVSDCLHALVGSGITWGVVTNKAERLARPLVERLLPAAAVVVGGDTTPHAKPHPAPLLEAARVLGRQPFECLYVGDDLRDIMAGKAACMKTAAANWGYLGLDTKPSDWSADFLLRQPDELLKELGLA